MECEGMDGVELLGSAESTDECKGVGDGDDGDCKAAEMQATSRGQNW